MDTDRRLTYVAASSMPAPTRPYSVFYFLSIANIGAYIPWLPPLLLAGGLSERAIGLALAAATLERALLPPLWGLVIDRAGGARVALASMTALAGVALLALTLVDTAASMVACVLLYGFAMAPVTPLCETLTLAALGTEGRRYGRVRLWGSVGFIVMALGLGWLVPRAGLGIVPYAGGLSLLAAALVARRLPVPAAAEPSAPRPPRAPGPAVSLEPVSALLAPAHVGELRGLPWSLLLPVLAAAALGQASHGTYYAFFTLQLEARGVNPEVIGGLWTIGVVAEIALMAWSPRLFERLNLVNAVRAALVLAIARWLVLASAPPLAALAVTQVAHAASFGLLHTASVQIIGRIMPPSRRALGQGLLSATAYGAGVGGGLALAGALAPLWPAGALYLVSAVLAAAGLVTALAAREPQPGRTARPDADPAA